MVFSIENRGLEVDHRIAGEKTFEPRLLIAFLYCGDELPGDGATKNFVAELEIGPGFEGLEALDALFAEAAAQDDSVSLTHPITLVHGEERYVITNGAGVIGRRNSCDVVLDTPRS